MPRLVLSVVMVCAFVRSAAASEQHHVAVAVNTPIAWLGGTSVAGSVFVGVADHHAIRANVARSDTWVVIPLALLGAYPEGYQKVTFDVGAGWVWYPEARFRGFSVEAGLLRRERHLFDGEPLDFEEYTMSDTTTYAVRGLAGYSWVIRDRLFVAAAVGVSAGYEHGTREVSTYTTSGPAYTEVKTERVSKRASEPEAYLRFGVAF